MKAAVFYGKRDMRVQEQSIQVPKDEEIVVKIAYCGVCGTDVHIFHGEEGSASVQPPVILGHEMSGVVYETGKAVKNLKPGDKVAIDPNFYCGTCYYCQNGQPHFCGQMQAVGVTQNGGFAEYCTMPAKSVFKVPDKMPLDIAAFAEPVACCLHGIELSNIRAGNQVLIIGAGTIGLIMLQLAKLSGASRITVIEPDQQKRSLAEKLGADSTFAKDSDYTRYANENSDLRADSVIECVGKAETVSFAIQAASKGATVMIFGLTPPQAKVEIYPFEIFKKELHITSSFVNPLIQPRAIELLGKLDIASLIDEYIPLEKLEEVLSNPAYRQKTKILVKHE